MKTYRQMTLGERWEFRRKVRRVCLRVIIVAALIGGICAYCAMDERENPFMFVVRSVHELIDPPEVIVERVWPQQDVYTLTITTEQGNATELGINDGWVTAEYSITDASGAPDIAGSGRLRVRRTNMPLGKKEPYDLALDAPAAVMGMDSGDMWCLRANCFDPTLLRNLAASSLAEWVGLPGAPDTRIAEVTLDGTFVGCYLISEPLETIAAREGLSPENGDLAVSYELNRRQTDITFFTTKDGLRFSVVTPPENEDVTEVFDDLTDILESGDYAAVCAEVDITSFAKAYLLDELFRSPQADTGYAYLFRRDGVFYAAPSWDFELSCGNNRAPHLNDTQGFHNTRTRLYRYLLEYPEFMTEVGRVYGEYADSIRLLYEDDGFIDTVANTHMDVIDRNYDDAGWVVWGKYLGLEREPDDTYAENLTYLREWLRARDEWLSEALGKTE